MNASLKEIALDVEREFEDAAVEICETSDSVLTITCHAEPLTGRDEAGYDEAPLDSKSQIKIVSQGDAVKIYSHPCPNGVEVSRYDTSALKDLVRDHLNALLNTQKND